MKSPMKLQSSELYGLEGTSRDQSPMPFGEVKAVGHIRTVCPRLTEGCVAFHLYQGNAGIVNVMK